MRVVLSGYSMETRLESGRLLQQKRRAGTLYYQGQRKKNSPAVAGLFYTGLNMELLFDILRYHLTVEEVNNAVCIVGIVR